MSCLLHCEDAWLPLDREDDHDAIVKVVADHYGERTWSTTLMLFATQFIPCPLCNIESMNNLVGVIDERIHT